MNEQPQKRCAIYTRKSREDGLEQEFNSLDAQHEACEAYIASQRFNGWTLVPTRYDDGGFSGGNTDRPGLRQLLKDIEAGEINAVVVYKIDRLSRSIRDFGTLFDAFEKHNVSFVSVTQQIDTSTPTGRMVLNILMSFAQFEREMTIERVRDKVAASKRKGIWMGGPTPFGYRIENHGLAIMPERADTVRWIFSRYLQLGGTKQIADELNDRGDAPRPNGKRWTPRHVYTILGNPTYIGKLRHGAELLPGRQPAIVDDDVFRKAQTLLKENAPVPESRRTKTQAPLKSLLRCGECDCAMMPLFSTKKGKRYMYYRCGADARHTKQGCPVGSIPAEDVEKIVFGLLARFLSDNALMADPRTKAALRDVGSLWNSLFPAERDRIVHLLVAKIVLTERELIVTIKTSGLDSLGLEISGATVDVGGNIELHEPVHFENFSGRRRLLEGVTPAVAPGGEEGNALRFSLLGAISHARRWLSDLASGRASNATDLAEAEGVERSYFRKRLSLASLAPQVLDAIFDNRIDGRLSIAKLEKVGDLDWPAQCKALGIA